MIGRAGWLSCLLTMGVVICTVALPSTARADSKRQQPGLADRIVFVGLAPLTGPNGDNDPLSVKQAQLIRVAIERAFLDLSKKPVLGTDGLTTMVGGDYQSRWLACRGDLGCIRRLLAPVRNAGYRVGVAGDYYVDDDRFHFRFVAFNIDDGTVLSQLRVDWSFPEVGDVDKWQKALVQLRITPTGRVRIESHPEGLTCTIDGQPCSFESDGKTLTTSPGVHSIDLAKEGYRATKNEVTVETGGTQELAVTLEPLPRPDSKPTPAPAAAGTAESPIVAPMLGRRAPRLAAVRVHGHIDIDGKLDDAAWQKAWVEPNFTQKFPDEGRSPAERTELRVLYDDDAIYVGIRCYDSRPAEIVSRLTRRDREVESDRVSVDISSKNDRATAFHFLVNAAGVQVDGARFDDTQLEPAWDAVWYSSTTRDNQGWTAELEIPFVALRYSGGATSFGFQVRRYLQRRQEIDEWSYVPSEASGEVSYYGTLVELTELNPSRLFQITPYDSRRVTFRTKQAFDGTASGTKIGADLKVGVTPSLTLDATVNPDFGTVEVDQEVLNLSTLEYRFPEKRPFFLEGADLFGTIFELFYSRRVGRTPPSTQVAGAAVELPPSGQILGAGKLTGVLANRLSIGVIEAVTAREEATIVRTPGAKPESVLVDPLTNFGVLRLHQAFGVNSSVGVLATAVNRLEPADRAAPRAGDACPVPGGELLRTGPPVKGRCTSDAYTGGVDTILRTGDGAWGASGQVVGSMLQHGPDRYIPDGTVVSSGDLGWGLVAQAGKYGGEHWLFDASYVHMAPKLRLNDAGFNSTANFQQVESNWTLRSTKPALGFRSTSLTLHGVYSVYADTHAPQLNPVSLQWKAKLSNFWSLSAKAGPHWNIYDNRETHDGALLQGPLTGRYFGSLSLMTDPRKRVIVSINAQSRRTLRGHSATGTIQVGLNLFPFLELELISDASWAFGAPRWQQTVTNPDSSRTYYFADQDARSWDALLRGTWTFSPTLSLQAYVQLYLDRGHFGRVTSVDASGEHPRLEHKNFVDATLPEPIQDFRDAALNVNTFLRWEYRPGSAFWLVYIRNQQGTPYSLSEGPGELRFDKLNGPSVDVILAKLSFMWEPFAGRH